MDESIDDSWDDILDVLVKEEPVMSPHQLSLSKPVGTTNDAFSISSNTSPKSSQHISKKRKANPDADDIAKATEEALMQLGLDPNSEEFKLKKRQIRNRISAQSHRDRKNHHITELEIEIAGKNKRIESLEKEVMLLKQENEQLRCLVQRMEISRTSSELSSRTDVESRHSVNPYAFPAAVLSSASSPLSSTNTNYLPLSSHVDGFPNNGVGSQTPDYSISSTASSASSVSLSSQPLTITSHHIPNPSSLTSSNPILKSLSFICVICVLCLCSNIAPSGNGTLSGVTVTNNMISQDDSLHRRLLTTAEEAMNASPALVESALNLLQHASNDASVAVTSENNHHNLFQTVSDVFDAVSNRSIPLTSTNRDYVAPRDNLRRRQLQHTAATHHNGTTHLSNRNINNNNNSSSSYHGLVHPQTQTGRWITPFLLPASSDLPAASTTGAPSMRVLRRDLLPFPITQGPQEDWFSYQARLQALSTSQVFLTQGVALLDPAFRPSDRLAALLLQQSTQSMTQQQPPSTVQRSPTVNVKRPRLHDPQQPSDESQWSLLPSIAQSSAVVADAKVEMDLDEEDNADNTLVVSTPLLPPPAMHGVDKTALDLVLPRMLAATSLTDSDAASAASASAAAKAPLSSPTSATSASAATASSSETASAKLAAAQLVSESNIVTVTIPASAIKLGHSLQESEQGTMDSLLRLFNLTASSTNSNNNSNNNINQTAVTLQTAWVEMNCIVVGAKVMWQALPGAPTDAASTAAEHATAASAMH